MTPERKEEIATTRGKRDWYTLQRYIMELLDALEEAQQQLWTAKEERDSQQRVCIKAMEELSEAQQTIARQREALEKIDKACRKRSFNDCGDLRAVVYDIAYAALGGETQP
jgi:chromosome segregation ATPase